MENFANQLTVVLSVKFLQTFNIVLSFQLSLIYNQSKWNI